jgi:hypothetical protein
MNFWDDSLANRHRWTYTSLRGLENISLAPVSREVLLCFPILAEGQENARTHWLVSYSVYAAG